MWCVVSIQVSVLNLIVFNDWKCINIERKLISDMQSTPRSIFDSPNRTTPGINTIVGNRHQPFVTSGAPNSANDWMSAFFCFVNIIKINKAVLSFCIFNLIFGVIVVILSVFKLMLILNMHSLIIDYLNRLIFRLWLSVLNMHSSTLIVICRLDSLVLCLVFYTF